MSKKFFFLPTAALIYSGKNKSTMLRKVICDQIVALKQAGMSDKEVMKHLNVCRKAVFNTMKCLGETGNISSLPIPGRKRSARTARSVEIVKKGLQRNPRRSVQKNAKGLKMSGGSVRKIVKGGLGLKACKFQRRHLISAASKKKRLDRGKKLLAEIERAGRKNNHLV